MEKLVIILSTIMTIIVLELGIILIDDFRNDREKGTCVTFGFPPLISTDICKTN